MRYGLNYYKQGDFGQILNTIHNKMRKNLTFRKDKAIAEEIESLLKEIKIQTRLLKQSKTGLVVTDKINYEVANLIEDTFQEQIQIHTSFKGSSNAYNLFQRAHKYNTTGKRYSIEGTDDIFEEQLAFLLTAASKKAKQSKPIQTNVKMFLFGQQSGYVKAMDNNLQKDIEQYLLKLPVEAAKNYARSAQAASKLGGVAQVRAGKVDIKSPNFQIEGNANDFASRIIRAFSGRTFSLKNYTSFKKLEDETIGRKNYSDINLHLGDSNLYKSITGSLSNVYSDPKIQQTIYYRGMEYLANLTDPPDTTSQDIVQQHFAHLRFIYELRGQGLISQNGQSLVADFIIWNDPNSDDIKVRSTNELIQRLADNYNNPFEAIKLKVSDF